MTDEERKAAAMARYQAAMHAVQAGIASRMGWDQSNTAPEKRFTSPKHMRVGVESAHVSQLGLAKLLITKGVFTEAEYYEAMANAAEEEKANWESSLADLLGAKITLV